MGFQGACRGLGAIIYCDTPLSGTIPSAAPFCEVDATGQLFRSTVRTATIFRVAATHISGTAPPCLFEDMPRVGEVYIGHQRLSGTIPDLSNSVGIRVLRAEVNNFVSLPQLSFIAGHCVFTVLIACLLRRFSFADGRCCDRRKLCQLLFHRLWSTSWPARIPRWPRLPPNSAGC